MHIESIHLLSTLAHSVGAEQVIKVVLPYSLEDHIRLLAHIDFAAEDPDPVFLFLLERHAGEEQFLRAADSQYRFPGEVVEGSYAEYLTRRKERLLRWAEVFGGSVEAWAEALIPRLESDTESERLFEAENF